MRARLCMCDEEREGGRERNGVKTEQLAKALNDRKGKYFTDVVLA